jgi:hypothetical protein
MAAEPSWRRSVGLRSRVAKSVRCVKETLLLLTLSGTRGLDAISAFDNICFEAYRTRATVELEEKATGVTEYRADFISSP